MQNRDILPFLIMSVFKNEGKGQSHCSVSVSKCYGRHSHEVIYANIYDGKRQNTLAANMEIAPECNIVALVPAGARTAADPVARVHGVAYKSLTPLAGIPMVVRVLNALQATGRVGSVVLIGPDRVAVDGCPPLRDFINRNDTDWVPARDRLSDSILAGLARIDADALALIVPADHALLDAEILNYFLDRAIDSDAGVSVGLVEYAPIRQSYPGVRRTVLKFSEGEYCGCNMYALKGSRASEIISFWQRVQAYRKQPWRMIHSLFGLIMLARYLSGRLSLAQARQTILEATGITTDFINLPFPHASIDVDTPGDLELVKRILE